MTPKIAIVVSDFNRPITDLMLNSAIKSINNTHYSTEKVKHDVYHVPGAVELPFAAQLLAKSKRYDAIVLLGCVIRGETNHYDYVCQQVSQGIQQVMLAYNLPVIFGVLTTENADQAKARIDRSANAIDTALRMIKLKADITNLT